MVRTVRVLDVGGPALVMGSTQSSFSVDGETAARAGVEVARRSSGGGAVLVSSGGVLWVDVFLPAGEPLWNDDIGRSAYWLGRTWTLALGDLGIEASYHEGAFIAPLWAHIACFAGLGPGEVTVGPRKAVGISQRRTRAGALFQCAALLSWNPGAFVELLALDAGARREAEHQLRDGAAALGVAKAALEEALIARLP
jgi:lipoate-protein ligase A